MIFLCLLRKASQHYPRGRSAEDKGMSASLCTRLLAGFVADKQRLVRASGQMVRSGLGA